MARNSQNSSENSSKMALQVSVQPGMTHILSSTTNISLVYTNMLLLSIYRGTMDFLRGYNGQKFSKFIRKFIRNGCTGVCTARNDSYTIQYQ